MAQFLSRKQIILVSGLTVAAILVAFWAGGRKKWEMIGVESDSAGTASLSSLYENEVKENPDDFSGGVIARKLIKKAKAEGKL